MATPEAIRTQILSLVKDYHTAKFAPKTFDPDKNLVHYAGRVFDAEEIITGVKAIFGGNERLARQASIYLCHKYSGAKLREIGRLFDMRETAISEASRRFSLKMGNDEKVLNLAYGRGNVENMSYGDLTPTLRSAGFIGSNLVEHLLLLDQKKEEPLPPMQPLNTSASMRKCKT